MARIQGQLGGARRPVVGVVAAIAALWLAGCGEDARLSAQAEDYPSAQNPGASTAGDTPARPVEETCSDNPLLAGCAAELPAVDANGAASADVDDNAPTLPPQTGNQFESPGTNPFVMVDFDPLSTFAVDVDTASYDVFRRYVEEGTLPVPASVRLEEYVNYFSYAYPTAPAEADVPFSVSLAAAPSALDPQLTLLRVGIQGKAPPATDQKLPTNLVFLVDVSGSMNQSDKLPLAQQVLRQTLDLLAPDDTVALVTYASGTEVRLAPTPAAERERIVAAIDGLVSSGGTNGAGGINLAYEQAQAGFIQGGINHVVLCTDGDFNIGPSSNAELVNLIRDKRQTGITFTALGFGSGNLNDLMLETISNAGNGFYGVITSEGQAADYVHERLLSTLSLIARDMKVQVEFNPAQVAAYRLLGYENRAIADQDFRDDVVDAGEIGAGHRVTALYELVLAGESLPEVAGAPNASTGASYAGVREVASADLVQVKVRYKHIDAGTTDPALEVAASLAPDAIAADLSSADLDLQWASAVAAFAEVLKQSPYAGAVNLDAVAEVLEAQSQRDADRTEFYELFLQARSML